MGFTHIAPTSGQNTGSPDQAEATPRRYTERLQALCEIGCAILAADSPAGVARAALERLVELVPCVRADVLVAEAGSGYDRILAVQARSTTSLGPGAQVSEELFGNKAELGSGRAHVLEDIQTSGQSPEAQALYTEGVRSYVSVPLISRDELIGSLGLGFDSPRIPSSDCMEIAGQVARTLALALDHEFRLQAVTSENAGLLEQVRASRARLTTLSRELVQAQEAERRKIARELHDEIGQSMTAVKISLQTLQRRLPDMPALTSRIDDSIAIVERTLQQVRTLSLDLRPSLLDDLGLVDTLRWYVDRQSQLAGFAAEFRADPPAMSLPPELETTCFRIVQEALTNVMRHAQARQVQVDLRQEGDGGLRQVKLTIVDDGVGFDVQTALKSGASSGLQGMQERVSLVCGEIDIQSAPGHGTTIRACFPFESPCPPDGTE